MRPILAYLLFPIIHRHFQTLIRTAWQKPQATAEKDCQKPLLTVQSVIATLQPGSTERLKLCGHYCYCVVFDCLVSSTLQTVRAHQRHCRYRTQPKKHLLADSLLAGQKSRYSAGTSNAMKAFVGQLLWQPPAASLKKSYPIIYSKSIKQKSIWQSVGC